jgi:hypothetical protein
LQVKEWNYILRKNGMNLVEVQSRLENQNSNLNYWRYEKPIIINRSNLLFNESEFTVPDSVIKR